LSFKFDVVSLAFHASPSTSRPAAATTTATAPLMAIIFHEER
jgi:hypothetical protein